MAYDSEVETPAAIVQTFFERMQARDWERAAKLLAPNVCIDFSETGERFEGNNYLAMNRAFPEGWSIEVVEAFSAGGRVATQVRVTHGAATYWCAGFYSVGDGVILSGVEHWVTERSQPPPRWRRRFASTDENPSSH